MNRDSLENESLLIDLESGTIQDVSIGERQRLNSENDRINLLGSNVPIGSEISANSCIEVIIRREEDEECRSLDDKKYEKKSHKKSSYKKGSKPPRPPKGPALDAADMILVKEISTHVMNKRARCERMKALRKTREESSSCPVSKSSVIAMIFTILFFVVICLQGFCSNGVSSVNLHGSPEPATNSLISVQFFGHPFANDGSGLGSSSSPEEQTVGSNLRFHG